MYKIEVGNQEKAAKIVESVTSDKLTVTELDGLMQDFVNSVTDGTHQDHGKIKSILITYYMVTLFRLDKSCLPCIQNWVECPD